MAEAISPCLLNSETRCSVDETYGNLTNMVCLKRGFRKNGAAIRVVSFELSYLTKTSIPVRPTCFHPTISHCSWSSPSNITLPKCCWSDLLRCLQEAHRPATAPSPLPPMVLSSMQQSTIHPSISWTTNLQPTSPPSLTLLRPRVPP